MEQSKPMLDHFFNTIEGLSNKIKGSDEFNQFKEAQQERKVLSPLKKQSGISMKQSSKLKRQDTGFLSPAVSGFES